MLGITTFIKKFNEFLQTSNHSKWQVCLVILLATDWFPCTGCEKWIWSQTELGWLSYILHEETYNIGQPGTAESGNVHLSKLLRKDKSCAFRKLQFELEAQWFSNNYQNFGNLHWDERSDQTDSQSLSDNQEKQSGCGGGETRPATRQSLGLVDRCQLNLCNGNKFCYFVGSCLYDAQLKHFSQNHCSSNVEIIRYGQ